MKIFTLWDRMDEPEDPKAKRDPIVPKNKIKKDEKHIIHIVDSTHGGLL